MDAGDVEHTDIEYGIDGGRDGIYDGIIVWVLKDGRIVNRFRGENSVRERKIDDYILHELQRSGSFLTTGFSG